MSETLPPIVKTVEVPWPPTEAFERFVTRFGEWWPVKTHSVGGPRVRAVVFEPRAGGDIYEAHVDGRRFGWGRVLEWAPPGLVRFTWYPSRDPSTAQEVTLRFTPSGSGTRLELVSDKWERWGKGARGAHRGYAMGWQYILNHWAGRRTFGMAVLDVIGAVIGGVLKMFRGGQAGVIARSGGELPRA